MTDILKYRGPYRNNTLRVLENEVLRPRREEITTRCRKLFDVEFRTFYCSSNINCDDHIKDETLGRVACIGYRKRIMWRVRNTWNGDTSKGSARNGTWRFGNNSRWIAIGSSGGSSKIPKRVQVPKKRGICDELCDYQVFKNNPAWAIHFFQVIYYVFNNPGPPPPPLTPVFVSYM